MGDRDGGVKGDVKEATDIVDLVSEHVPQLVRSGIHLKALCPFHDDHDPSLMVNPGRQTFRCFVCEEGGDVFTFTEKIFGIDFREALLFLGERAGIPITYSSGERKEAETRKSIYSALEEACLVFQSNLPGSPAESYLRNKRGFSSETIEKFRLGFSLNSWDDLFYNLTDRGISPRTLVAAGLAKERRSGGHFNFFRNRVMFPIFNNFGKVVGFGARTLEDEEPKYLNGPDTLVFKKKRILYGLDRAFRAARREKELFIVEGYTDVNRCHQEGLGNFVATIGTAFTPEHALILQKSLPHIRIFLCYDGDKAGQDAALRTIEKIPGRAGVHVCFLPKDQDPASILEAGEDLRAKLANTISSFDFYADRKSEGLNLRTAEDRVLLIKRIQEHLDEVPQGLRGIYIETLAQKMGITPLTVRTALYGEPEEPPISDQQDPRVVEAEFVRQLAHTGSLEAVAYFSKLVSPEEDFSMPETRLTFQYFAKREEHEPLQLEPQTSLFGGITPDEVIGEINRRAEKAEVVLNQTRLRSLLQRPSQLNPTLRSMEHTYVMMMSSYLPNEIGTACWNGDRDMKDLVSIVRNVRRGLRNGQL